MIRIALGVSIVGLLTTNVAALPEWARPLADDAPIIEADPSSTPARVLYAETALRVSDEGHVEVRRRLAVQALNARTEEVGLGWFGFTEGARILGTRAWHLPPDAKRARRSREETIDVAFDRAFLSDSRTRHVPVSGVRKGSLVFFEFSAMEPLPLLTYRHLFLENGPIDVARFSVELPEGWSVRWNWPRGSGVTPHREGASQVWELRGLTEPDDEPLGLHPFESAPLLVIGIDPPAEHPATRTHTARAWRDFGLWYERLLGERAAVTPEIRSTALAIPFPDQGDPFSRTRAATLYVRDRVRYVAKSIGIGSLQPRRASEVLHDLWGDCKDKGTLLGALLGALDQPAYPVLVHASMRGTVSDEVPDIGAFDHFVVAVPISPADKLPGDLFPASIDVEGLGRLLIVDPTHEYLAPGDLPASLAGKRALIVAGERSHLVTLPIGSPETHRSDHRLEIEVSDDLSRMTLVSQFHGEAAVAPLATLRASQVDRRREIESAIARTFIGARFEDWAVVIDGDEAPLTERLVWTVPRREERLELFPLALELVPRTALTRRRGPIVLRHPLGVTYRAVVRDASGPVRPGSDVELSGDGWSVRTQFEPNETGLAASLELRLDRLAFDLAELDELRAFWRAAERGAGVLVPLGP